MGLRVNRAYGSASIAATVVAVVAAAWVLALPIAPADAARHPWGVSLPEPSGSALPSSRTPSPSPSPSPSASPSPSPSPSRGASRQTPAPSSVPAPAPAPAPRPSAGLSSLAIAGIVVGAVLFAAATPLVVIALRRRPARPQRASERHRYKTHRSKFIGYRVQSRTPGGARRPEGYMDPAFGPGDRDRFAELLACGASAAAASRFFPFQGAFLPNDAEAQLHVRDCND